MSKKDNIKKILFGTLLILLLCPLLQGLLSVVTVNPLKGDIKEVKYKEFTVRSWFYGTFQKHKEKYLNEKFGFRNIFVRLNNQISYSLFDKIAANGVVIGKNNYFYEENYIKAYFGLDFIGADSIKHRMEKLRFIEDTLKQLKKNVLLVFAAGKGSFYPEYFPDTYSDVSKNSTNSEYYIKYAHSFGINFIDFNQYFVENKHKSKYPLYPQYGNHWSQYGSCLAADSIIRYIEYLRNIDMPDFIWNRIDSAQPYGVDYDVADGMNLFFRLKSFDMAYPNVHAENIEGKTKPSALVISDSFFWSMYNEGLSNCFSNLRFWFYNKQAFPGNAAGPLDVEQVNLNDEVLNSDIIIIMGSTATLPDFGWGFIENTYNMFKGIKLPDHNKSELEKLKEKIMADKEWLEKVEMKAGERGISVDSMVTLDYLWLMEHEK